jgi:ribose transport system permease protein
MAVIRKLVAKPWIWAYLGALAVWLVTIIYNGGSEAAGF